MAIKNRLVKLITISAGACLILGSLAGCKPAEEPEATAAASEAQEESETETEAPQASVATSDTEDPAESDLSDDFVIEPEYIELGSEEQKYVNTYITNFVEQYFFDFDSDCATAEQLLDFVHIHLKINAYDQISYETKGDITFETFTVSEATKVITKYFSLYFTEDDCKVLPAPPETYGDQPAGPFYEDGKIWYEAADGESYNLIGIVDSVLNNTDGTLTLEFTIYSIDYEVYNELDMDGITAYYSMTPEQAAADSTLTRVKNGTAVVTNAQSGDYLLISYSTN